MKLELLPLVEGASRPENVDEPPESIEEISILRQPPRDSGTLDCCIPKKYPLQRNIMIEHDLTLRFHHPASRSERFLALGECAS